MSERLTAKQEKFVRELIKGKSQRKAYKAAYNTSRMKDTTIDESACKLLADSKVSARYNELRDRMAEQAIMRGLEVLSEITSIAQDDISNYLSFSTGENGVVIELKDSAEVNTKNISEISLSANGDFKFKLYRRDTALYELAKIFGLSKEQLGDPEAVNRAVQSVAELLKKPLPNRVIPDE